LFMEMAARKLLAEHLPTGSSSVGARVDVRHLAPSQVGAAVRAVAEITEVNGNKITFSVEAWDEEKQIGSGTHWRVVIDEARFMEKARTSHDAVK
jgi:fluoroacetyl-CoA thioesterase